MTRRTKLSCALASEKIYSNKKKKTEPKRMYIHTYRAHQHNYTKHFTNTKTSKFVKKITTQFFIILYFENYRHLYTAFDHVR